MKDLTRYEDQAVQPAAGHPLESGVSRSVSHSLMQIGAADETESAEIELAKRNGKKIVEAWNELSLDVIDHGGQQLVASNMANLQQNINARRDRRMRG